MGKPFLVVLALDSFKEVVYSLRDALSRGDPTKNF